MTKSPLLYGAGGFFRYKGHHKPDCCGQSGLWFPEDSKRVLRATFA